MSLEKQYLGFLKSKSLWNDRNLFGLHQFNFEELSIKAKIPNVLHLEIRKNEVLGKRVEHFFGHLITSSDRLQLIANNIQVFSAKITIGELDFIVKDFIEEKVLHIELIYKFYLYDPEIEGELERWIGPNRKDTLLQKIEKLKQKQLPLLYKEETKPHLKDLNLNHKNITQQVCYLANLFVPFSIKENILPHINNNCIVGYWIKVNDFTPEKYNASLFYLPEKKDWLVQPEYGESWHSYETILQQMHTQLEQKKSPLLWMKNNGDIYSRLFVVWW
ncbi:DUF1853 family protein [Aquimarina sp. MMG016]|uniref:DUF1853 family protein n=1 Tax=Aquimarina sp. MMG016 TaxID=2822690 RepID=UPI001B3A10C0|nr:DUF1853 family protein [Aquimarina sp. MMG016]MBQ4822760.1 DUF1853 family protein [Aquimarina sp. MMG016]